MKNNELPLYPGDHVFTIKQLETVILPEKLQIITGDSIRFGDLARILELEGVFEEKGRTLVDMDEPEARQLYSRLAMQ